MEVERTLPWLRRVLLVKLVVTPLLWGLPALLGPPALLRLFGIEMPDDPVPLRSFGAAVTAVTLIYWYAYRDPIRNVALIKYGIVDCGLCALTLLALAITVGLAAWFYWVSAVLLVFFTIAFAVLLPRSQAA